MTRGKLALIIVVLITLFIDISYFIQHGNPFNNEPTNLYCVFSGLSSAFMAIAGPIVLFAYIVENWNKKV